MRTKTLTVFTVDELNDKAREHAYHKWYQSSFYPWKEEVHDSRTAFENIFPVKTTHWSIDEWTSDVRFAFTGDDDIRELSGLRLHTYLQNHYADELSKGKYYSKSRVDEGGVYHSKSRRSRILKERDCALTGVWIDSWLLDPVYQFLDKPTPQMTFYELMQDCLESWADGVSTDMRHYFSQENFTEEAHANEWEYDEHGNLV